MKSAVRLLISGKIVLPQGKEQGLTSTLFTTGQSGADSTIRLNIVVPFSQLEQKLLRNPGKALGIQSPIHGVHNPFKSVKLGVQSNRVGAEEIGGNVGAIVGANEGDELGALVGLAVGNRLGANVGSLVRYWVGEKVGLLVGDTVGPIVGEIVGF